MKKIFLSKAAPTLSLLILTLAALSFSIKSHAEEPKGLDSIESYELVLADPASTFIIDVRTRAEYEFVGHPDLEAGVPNIPLLFYPSWEMNENFVADVEKRYTKEVTIITMCRSGKRARTAAELLLKAGFKNVYYMTDSFEGDTDENGHRTINGWKNNGLPYTYTLDRELVYR